MTYLRYFALLAICMFAASYSRGAQTGSHLGQHLHINIAYKVLAKAVCPIITVCADSSWSNPSRAL